MNDHASQPRQILDFVYQHEAEMPDRVFLTQPVPGMDAQDYTWKQVMDQARRMATYLKAQGFAPGARIAMISNNCAHFIIAELAIWMAGYTTVAIFSTESVANIRYVLTHSEASLLFVGKLDHWPQQCSAMPEGLPCIALPLAPATSFPSWDSIIAGNAPLAGQVLRSGSDLALICYTSGSTGQPKGVMHSFARASHASELIVEYLESLWGKDQDSRVMSYLPLAHIFERAWLECASLVHGRTHIFFAESLVTFLQDLQRARPTSFISVPRLWLKFQQGVFAKMPAEKLRRLLKIPFLGRIVARKVLHGLGLDHVISASSGSAPIPAEVISWYRSLGLNLLEGYGMTEDFAYSHGSSPAFNAPGYVGVPFPRVEVRLSEEGEILIKSPGQMVGYYKEPELTADALTPDGFFRTGDMGERQANGLLKISGRIKEIFKTAKGKYVAPAPIEDLFMNHPLIESCMVSGVGQVAPYVVLVLEESLRGKLGDQAVRSRVESELDTLLIEINAKLASYETLAMVVVSAEPWTVENGCLTPTMKIKRSKIEAGLNHQLDAWYQARRTVLWS